MKTLRLLAALLVTTLCVPLVFPQDTSEFLALRGKAEKGNAVAQYNLGLAYLAGTGTAANPIESFVWLSVARENGARGRALDNLVATMDRSTHEAAIQRLAQFRSTSGLVPAPVRAAPATTPTTPASAGQPAAARSPDQAKTAAPASAPADGADAARLRLERDAAVAKLNEMTGETTTLRAERERLIARAADNSKAANDARATSAGLQEQLQVSNTKLAELTRTAESNAVELVRTQQALAALEKAPKPAPDTAALEAKTREWQAALAELEASRQFGREVETTLNKVTDQKQAQETALRVAQENFSHDAAALQTQLAAATQGKAAAEQQLAELTTLKSALEDSRGKLAASEQKTAALTTRIAELEQQAVPLTGSRAEADAARQQLITLKAELATASAAAGRAQQEAAALTTTSAAAQQQLARAATERTALEQEIAQLRAQPVAPAYPDLTGRVRELETQLAAKPAAPAYPDLAGRVSELAAQTKDQQAAINRLTNELASAQQESTAQAKAREAALAASPKYPDLSAKVQQLEAQLAAGNQQNVTALSAATAQVDQLKTELATAKSAAPAYPNLSGKVQELETQLATAKSAAPAYPDLSAKVSELESQLTASQAAVASAQSEASQAKALIAAKPAAPAYPDLTGKVATLENQLAALQADRERMQKLLADTGKKLRDNTVDSTRIKTLETQAAEAKNALANAESQVTSLIAERTTTRQALDEQRRANAALSQEKMQLSAALQTAQTAAPAYPDLTARVQELEAALAAKPGAPSYPDLSGQVRELETQLAAAGQQNAAALSAATAQVDLLKAELAATTATSAREVAAAKSAAPAYPDLSSQVRTLEAQLAAANELALRAAQVATASSQQSTVGLTAASAQIAELKAVQAALTDANASAKQEIAALALANAEAQKPVAPAYPDLAGKVQELETALAETSRQLIATTANQADTQQKLLAATAALPSAAENSAALRRERDELAGRVTGLTDEVAQLRTDRERMQKMLADAGRQMRDATADAGRIKELEAQTALLVKAKDEAQAQSASAQAALAAKSEAPAYPNLADTVRALEGKVENLQAELAAKPVAIVAAPAYPDLTGRVSELETALTAAQGEASQAKARLATLAAVKTEAPAPVSAPAYPDLSGKVQELEAQIGSLQNARAATPIAAPAYPDLTGRVSELEAALADTNLRLAAEQARAAAASVTSTPGVDADKLQQQLAETEDKLATALRGYVLLEKERDSLAAHSNKATEAVSAERNALAAQVTTLTSEIEQLRTAATQAETLNQVAALTADKQNLTQRLAAAEAQAQTNAQDQTAALTAEQQRLTQRLAETEARASAAAADATRANATIAALQRSSAQATNDLNASRALAQQLQGANSVMATENYQLKTMLSRTVTPAGPTATPAPVIAAGPTVRSHVVVNGDSLSRISQRYYGATNRWQEIYNANRDKIGNDGVLRVGTELRIP